MPRSSPAYTKTPGKSYAWDVFEDDHLTVPLFESHATLFPGVFVYAGKDLGIHIRDASGGSDQSLTLGVFTYGIYDGGDSFFDFSLVYHLYLLARMFID